MAWIGGQRYLTYDEALNNMNIAYPILKATIENNHFNNGTGGIIMYGADTDVPDIYDEITGGSHGIKDIEIKNIGVKI